MFHYTLDICALTEGYSVHRTVPSASNTQKPFQLTEINQIEELSELCLEFHYFCHAAGCCTYIVDMYGKNRRALWSLACICSGQPWCKYIRYLAWRNGDVGSKLVWPASVCRESFACSKPGLLSGFFHAFGLFHVYFLLMVTV